MLSSPQATKNQQNIPTGRILSALIIIGCFAVTLLFWQSKILHVSLPDLFEQIKTQSYFPHYNGFYAGKMADSNMMQLYYHFLLTFLVLTLFVHGICSISNKWLVPTSPLYIVRVIGLTGLLLMAGIQQLQREKAWDKETSFFEGKTIEQKNLLIFGQLYAFSKTCQQLLPGRHQAELITDFKIAKDPFMTAQRILAYHLYPNLSIRFNNKTPKDCLILFYKTNPLSMVPDDYTVLTATKDENYVLAIQRASWK